MGKKDTQRRARRLKRKRAIWRGENTDDYLKEMVDSLNERVCCCWCGFPATCYTTLDGPEPNSVRFGPIPGTPPEWKYAVHMTCIDDLQEAIRMKDEDLIQRAWPHHLREDPFFELFEAD